MGQRLRRAVLVVLGVLLFAVGVLWALQGLGYLTGSSMSDVQVWAVIGPVVAGLGVALVISAFRPTS